MQQNLAETTKLWVTLVFTGAMLYQMVHVVEHVAQVYQHWWLGLSLHEAHGILFFFDLEWNHFTFNTIYWILLWTVFLAGCFFRKNSAARQKPLIFYAFIFGGLLTQTYHQIEHFTRIYQHLLTLNCQPCPGILGWHVDGVYLHFFLNVVVLILPLVAFFSYGYLKKLLNTV